VISGERTVYTMPATIARNVAMPLFFVEDVCTISG